MNDAYGWNCLNKTIQTSIPGTDYFYVKEGLFYDLSRNECKEYEQKLTSKSWSTFDIMIKHLSSINRISININNWRETTCTCSDWQKDYKCNHQISVCARLKKCAFDIVAMDLPIQPNRKRGAPEKNKPALIIQPSDSVGGGGDPKGISYDDDDLTEVVPNNQKKQKTFNQESTQNNESKTYKNILWSNFSIFLKDALKRIFKSEKKCVCVCVKELLRQNKKNKLNHLKNSASLKI
ncbi:hypothetical protein BpHYR1_018099 [Brachionus plicatilis]|uniref:SWIM-type domain-containing protein n=2 Tax=Brachionus plicatilis TaxID=10195 RepID=A0A3M7Q2C3_BRAPC|nr:hypothetical protein BpHYR1_018099 [Brachionus plicatilis]